MTINDFDYDCMQRKKIAASAKHIKRGSKSKRCTLPSDNLTAAQLRKRNGEIKNMDLTKPTSFKDFKTWPIDLQKEYLTRYIKEFGCSINDLSMIFNVSPPTLRNYLKKIEFDNSVFSRGKHMSKANRMRFHQWLRNYRPDFTDNKQEGEDPQQVVQDGPTASVAGNLGNGSMMGTPRICMDFTGILNVSQISRTLLSLAEGKRVRVSVTIEEDVDE